MSCGLFRPFDVPACADGVSGLITVVSMSELANGASYLIISRPRRAY